MARRIGYDANGNISNDGVASYTWNGRNQLISRGSTSFQYDSFGRVARSCIEQAYSKHLPNCSEGGPLLAVFCKGRVLTALTLLVFSPASSSRQCHSPGLSRSVHTSNLESCSTATAPVPSLTRVSLDSDARA